MIKILFYLIVLAVGGYYLLAALFGKPIADEVKDNLQADGATLMREIDDSVNSPVQNAEQMNQEANVGNAQADGTTVFDEAQNALENMGEKAANSATVQSIEQQGTELLNEAEAAANKAAENISEAVQQGAEVVSESVENLSEGSLDSGVEETMNSLKK